MVPALGNRRMSWSNSTTVASTDAVSAAATEQQILQRTNGVKGQMLTVLKPHDHRDATTAIAMVRSNQVVLINCSALDERQAQRLIDMVSGGVLAMDGQVRQISPQVVLACSALTVLQHESAKGRGRSRPQRR